MEKIQLRKLTNDNGDEIWVDGYASVFNQYSKKLYDANGKPFYELIHVGAFDEVLQGDLNVIMNFNHDNEQILARTTSGTLTLTTDEYGLKFSFKMPNTQLGRDLVELIERGDIYECSFAFIPDKQTITISKHPDGTIIREIYKVIGLFDCALVIDGAYSDTTITLRGYDAIDEVIEEEPQPEPFNELEILQLQINILKIKNK